MTFGDLEKLCRREINDESGTETSRRVQSYQMLAYANEAEAEACIRARLITESTVAEICHIPIVAGISVYTYDPRIVLILRGKVVGAKDPLGRVSHTMMDEQVRGWEDLSGEARAFVTGLHSGKIMLYRKPVAAGQLNLTAVRTPLAEMTTKTSTPEINSRLHPALIYWMKHKIYNNQDSELFDKNRADVHLAAFEDKFGKRTSDPFNVFDEMQIPNYIPDNHWHNGADYGLGNDGYY